MRKVLRARRKSVSTRYQYKASISALHYLLKNNVLRYKHIAIYSASDGEMQTRKIINFLTMHARIIYLPVLDGPRLKFARLTTTTQYRYNRFGILEPQGATFHAKKINLVITPLVGYDECGNRLGMGGGFYDKTFGFKQVQRRFKFPKLYGLAYDFQQTTITPNPWDITLDRVVTQKRSVKC